jgi:hypothetical protein
VAGGQGKAMPHGAGPETSFVPGGGPEFTISLAQQASEGGLRKVGGQWLLRGYEGGMSPFAISVVN